MWSFGGILDLKDRHNLQKVLYEDSQIKGAFDAADMPPVGNNGFMFDYFINDQGQW